MSFHRWLPLLLRLKVVASIQHLVHYLSGTGLNCSMLACNITGYVSLHNQMLLHNFEQASIY